MQYRLMLDVALQALATLQHTATPGKNMSFKLVIMTNNYLLFQFYHPTLRTMFNFTYQYMTQRAKRKINKSRLCGWVDPYLCGLYSDSRGVSWTPLSQYIDPTYCETDTIQQTPQLCKHFLFSASARRKWAPCRVTWGSLWYVNSLFAVRILIQFYSSGVCRRLWQWGNMCRKELQRV